MTNRAINGTFRKVIKCEYCTEKPAVVALLVGSGFKDLCVDCAFEYGADDSELADDCEGCNYTPCLCGVPQSERWEGR